MSECLEIFEKRDRLQQIEEMIPDIWNYKTILYIGAKVVEKTRKVWGGMKLIPEFYKMDYTIDILEIWAKNVQKLELFNREEKVFKNIFEGDIRTIERYIKKQKYDIVMWYHGPEHVEEIEVEAILKKLEIYAEKLVIAACPWGVYEKGSIEKNTHEIHTSHLYPEFFESLGWETDVIGPKDIPGSNILTWKRRVPMPELRDRPWLPEKAIGFLDRTLNKEDSVLEFGAGASTIWFAQRVKNVLSFEHSEIWFNLVRERLKKLNLNNVNLKFDPQYRHLGIRDINQEFDFILIDGRGRVKCTRTSYDLLKEWGWIGLDDSWRLRYLDIHILFDDLAWRRKDVFDRVYPRKGMSTFTLWRKPGC